MTRYAQGTRLDYTPFDRRVILEKVLGRLSWTPPEAVRELAYDLVRGCRTEQSTRSYAQELVGYLRWCAGEGVDPLEATEDDALAYAAAIDRYAQGTQHLKLLTIRRLFKMAIKRKLVEENPFEHITFPSRLPETRTPALTKAQIETVLTATTSEFDDPVVGLSAMRDYALITVLVRLCLRTSEAASLRWGRFSESSGRMRISFVGKGRKPAHLDLPDDVWRTLQNWRLAYQRATGQRLGPSDPVFLPVDSRALLAARSRTGSSPLAPMTRYPVYAIVRSRLGDVGIIGDRFSPHCLRATGAVLAFRGGATIVQVQALLRHSSVETTMRYLDALVGGAATEAIDRIRIDAPVWDEDRTDRRERGAA